MSRQHRTWFPGAMYHITARGNKQSTIFYDYKDHEKYLTLLAETKEISPFSLHSYCIMKNHVHLLLETHEIPITDIMKNINTHYAIYFNKRYDVSGHVFQGRYNAELITDASYFLNASRYIHLNPLEAEVCKDLENYDWSSYSAYFSSLPNPLVTTERILSYFQEPQQENYRQFILTPKNKEVTPTCQS